MDKIETGVDRLVALVAKEKKLELNVAAKELNVSPMVVQEWANFLEEQGLISIEYSLSKVFLVERRLSKKEIAVKQTEYSSKKDAFIRKVESAIRVLDSETESFNTIKDEFKNLQSRMGPEISDMKDDLKKIHEYQDAQKNLRTEIENQKKEYEDLVEKAAL